VYRMCASVDLSERERARRIQVILRTITACKDPETQRALANALTEMVRSTAGGAVELLAGRGPMGQGSVKALKAGGKP